MNSKIELLEVSLDMSCIYDETSNDYTCFSTHEPTVFVSGKTKEEAIERFKKAASLSFALGNLLTIQRIAKTALSIRNLGSDKLILNNFSVNESETC